MFSEGQPGRESASKAACCGRFGGEPAGVCDAQLHGLGVLASALLGREEGDPTYLQESG